MSWDAALKDYKAAMLKLPADRALTKEDLLAEPFLIAINGELEVYYSPHNEYVNDAAEIVIMGLTPGWAQMKIAYEEALRCMRQGLADEETVKRAKAAARFAGPMRRNLIAFLDELELYRYLRISSSEELFGEADKLLHTVSALRYPVFKNKRNYTGSQPELVSTPFLADWACESIAGELRQLRNQPLIIPLGKAVEGVLNLLVQDGQLAAERVLWGFPHPSGANGHRKAQFQQNKSSMLSMLRQYFT